MNAADEQHEQCAGYEHELEREDFKERLRSIIPHRGENAFARRAGISPSGLRGALKNGNPGREMLNAIAREGGVSLEWLATGQGPRERAPGQAQGTADPAPAYRPARPARREAAPRTGLYEPDEDPDYHRWPLDIGVFHAIVNAADSVGADLDRGCRTEMARWMYLAIDIMTRAPDNRRRLDDADMRALAIVARKLIFTDEKVG